MDRIRLRVEGIGEAGPYQRVPVLEAHDEVAGAGGTLADWQDAQAVMTDEVDRMGGLVADLLLLARVDEGALQPHPVEVDLDDLVMAECRRLRAQTSLQVMAVVTPVKVSADSDELGRSLRNLADNAARHARTRVRITIGADRLVRSGWGVGATAAPALIVGGRGHPVSESSDGLDAVRAEWNVDLATQIADVDLDDVGRPLEVRVPHVVENLRLRGDSLS